MNKLLSRIITKATCLSVFMVMISAFITMAEDINTSYEDDHNLRIEELNSQLLEAENEEEIEAINILIQTENNKWEETRPENAYLLDGLGSKLFVISFTFYGVCYITYGILKLLSD